MKFEVFYVDPPWSFTNKRTGGSMKSGSVQKYPTMPLEAIKRLPVQALAAPNAVLFLWVPTALKFSHGAACLHSWGFDYVTTVYWDKQRQGMGFWFRNYVEELLVAKMNRAPFRCQLPNIIHQPPGEHSSKPDAFRQLIETATGSISSRKNLELFARKTAPGWTTIGQSVTGNDIGVDIRELVTAA